MKRLLMTLTCLLALPAWAQIAPLPVESDTVALWNFNDDTATVVLDSAPSPMNGEPFSTAHVAVPGLPLSFELGRQFSVPSSFVDLGIVQGSKIDFTGAQEFRVEAVIRATSGAPGIQLIYSSDNVRLAVSNNQLAAIVRQPGGLYGVVSPTTIQLDTAYRVGLHFKNKVLVLTINGRIDSKVTLDYLPSAPEFASNRGFIGGSIFGQFFRGYIDDVRVSNTAGVDLIDPEITVVEPASFQVSTPTPNYLITMTDTESGVDVSTVVVTLNGIQQPGLTITPTQISGQMDPLQLGILNELKIIAADFAGNTVTKTYYLTYVNITSKGEYQPDANTLALWHMNDFSPGKMVDASAGAHHGIGESTLLGVSDGVFSKGKVFNAANGSSINFDGVRIDQKVTFEGWFQPTANGTSEILFYNGQFAVTRFSGGFIRVIFYTTASPVSFESPIVALPLGEMHHLAVTWDGTLHQNNLKFYRDGALLGTVSALADCDFDPIPKTGQIGLSYTGIMDELRVSNIVRSSFNIPTLENQVITFMSLSNGTSTALAHPELHAVLNSAETIQVDTVKVRLNGVLQPVGGDLTVTTSSIDGTMASAAQVGMNEVEIEFTDSANNVRKKSQYFYRIETLGQKQYAVDASTAGLWNFDQLSIYQDSSGNNYNFTPTGPFSKVDGVVGSGASGGLTTGPVITMQCRNHSFEGYFKSPSNSNEERRLYIVSGGGMNQDLYLNPSNGNLRLALTLNGVSSTTIFPGVFPTDGAYHHVAIVYDGSRGFSQMLVVIDGNVKGEMTLKNSCNVLSGLNYTVGATGIHYDELRISKVARYGLGVRPTGTDVPGIEGMNLTEGQTVTTNVFGLTFNIADADGVDTSKSKVWVNDIEQVVSYELAKKDSLAITATSEIELTGGANTVKIKAVDQRGNESLKTLVIFAFIQLSPAPYVADADSLFLYHFDEMTPGTFADATGNTSMPTTNWYLGYTVPNVVFGGAAANFSHSNQVQIPETGFSSFTYEAWFKGPAFTGMTLLYSTNGITVFSSNGYDLAFRSVNTNVEYKVAIPAQYQNGQWHHYAVVADATNLTRNLFLLIDGKVIGSFLVPVNDLLWSRNAFYIGQQLNGQLMDEARLSKRARYELISTF